MTEHTWHKCDKESCFICEGGLGACTVCGEAEGALTTECCGRRLTEEEVDRIYRQKNLDFKNGQWVNESAW